MNLYDIAIARKLSGGGGGGGSDFSTATVTITNTLSGQIKCRVAIAQEANPPFKPHAGTQGVAPVLPGNTSSFTAILYQGYCTLFAENANALSGTGNVTIMDTIAEITGDCTITIN